jgi:hypothetical protein
MDAPTIPLFTPEALAVLDRQPYDPAAKGRYELMSGGLIWGDEFPELGSAERQSISAGDVWRFLVAYRASITLGDKEWVALRPLWEQVVREAPNWPGLRPERWGEKARKRLLAARRRQAACLDEFESRKSSPSPLAGEGGGASPPGEG